METINTEPSSLSHTDFKEKSKDRASFDKKAGEGRANPMGGVEDMEKRDVKDTLLNGLDLIKGGVKLNENKKREDNPGFQLERSIPLS
ncbi:hypothetical protein [Sapientia aquatica]|uniref:Uncharacterized protein n=1 Tax=Sapientia aquatica TaxID=1549640 RepID=A0A4R5VV45_9BURK|nr:hypothetical protein [Sapientia aquatica]TDK61981.1 hypothetical protein E2I14_17020 [Sapientia aquatica]